MIEYAQFHGFTHELIDYSVPDDDLVPCKVCEDRGKTFLDFAGGGMAYYLPCPCISRRPCDPLCRCSGGPL